MNGWSSKSSFKIRCKLISFVSFEFCFRRTWRIKEKTYTFFLSFFLFFEWWRVLSIAAHQYRRNILMVPKNDHATKQPTSQHHTRKKKLRRKRRVICTINTPWRQHPPWLGDLRPSLHFLTWAKEMSISLDKSCTSCTASTMVQRALHTPKAHLMVQIESPSTKRWRRLSGRSKSFSEGYFTCIHINHDATAIPKHFDVVNFRSFWPIRLKLFGSVINPNQTALSRNFSRNYGPIWQNRHFSH